MKSSVKPGWKKFRKWPFSVRWVFPHATVHELIQRGASVNYHSSGGWFIGRTEGPWHKNVELRTFQYQKSFDDRICLDLARSFVRAKIANCRTIFRRNRREKDCDSTLDALNKFKTKVDNTNSLESLLGIEGGAAASLFSTVLRTCFQYRKVNYHSIFQDVTDGLPKIR